MLSIVIVSFNSASVIKACQHEVLVSARFPIIIVDNASTDGSADELSRAYPTAQLIRMPYNQGYGRAANAGLAEVKTPYAFLLNPDMKVTVLGVEAMLAFACQHRDGAVLFAPAVAESDFVGKGAVRRDWLIGAALLFRMDAFLGSDFFDPNIFLFFEETDLCRRLCVANQGLLLNTDIYLHHQLGQSVAPNPRINSLKDWHFGWSRLYFLYKHNLLRGRLAGWRLSVQILLKAAIAMRSVKRSMYLNRAKGMIAYMRGEAAFMPNGRAQRTDRL